MQRKVIPISKSSIGIKCGDCIHYKRNAKFEKVCNDLGRKSFADAPNCYSPDVYILSKHNPEALSQLALLYKDFTAQETRVFMSLLKNAKAFEKAKLKFGMPVYFRISNDFLANYYRGFVLNVTNAGEQRVYVTSDLNKTQRDKPMVGDLMRESVFTVPEFKKKKAQLQKSGHLVDSKPTFSSTTNKTELSAYDYHPPSMESAPKEWFDKQDRAKPKAKSKLSRGIDGTLEFKL
jgi:hypothetical protein